MNERMRTFLQKESFRTSYSFDPKKTNNLIQTELNLKNNIKLGDKLGYLFDNRKIVSLNRKICTPTSDWKNYEIKRKEFTQKVLIEPQVSKDYLKMLVKLLNKKDKNYLKERQELNLKYKRKSFKDNKEYINRNDYKELTNQASTLRLEDAISYNQSRNKMSSTYHHHNKFKTEFIPFEKRAFSNFLENKRSEVDEISTINPNYTTQNKLLSEHNFHKIDNIPYFLLENYQNQQSEDENTEENHIIIETESHGSQLSNFDDQSKVKAFTALRNKSKNENLNKRKKEKLVLGKEKKQKDEINKIPFVKNIKLLLNDFRIMNHKTNLDNDLQKIYVLKSPEKKTKLSTEDIFKRIREIDHNRNKKLKEMFSK